MTQPWRTKSRVFDTRAKEYDSWFENSLLFAIEAAAIHSLAPAIASPALEIGVGPGRFAEKLGSGFGIDPAFAPLQLSKERGLLVCQGIGEQLPFKSHCFATVSLFFTLCFLESPQIVLQEAKRVLKKTDGTLLLGFVPQTGAWGKNLQKKKEDGHPFYAHANFFTIAEVTDMITGQGFSIQQSTSTLFQPPEDLKKREKPRSGTDPDAGFVVIQACTDDR